MPGGVSQQVAVFVVLAQAVGAGSVLPLPVLAGAVQAVVEVPEGDLPVFGDGVLNGVHIIVDGLVHAFDPAGNQHVPAHEPGVVDTALAAKLFDELPGLFLREKFTGLDGIDEQLQFRQLKIPGGDVVASALAGQGHDIHAVILQGRHIGIDGFSVTFNIVLPQKHFLQLRSSHRVRLVGVSLQIIQNIEDFQLLIVRLGHGNPSLEVHYSTSISGSKGKFAFSEGMCYNTIS